eukprot:COSAG05_NODE_6431_length_959_cov_1.312791_1_plen_26_part_10
MSSTTIVIAEKQMVVYSYIAALARSA